MGNFAATIFDLLDLKVEIILWTHFLSLGVK